MPKGGGGIEALEAAEGAFREEVRYTRGVKAAVSLPDPLFEAADDLAKRLGLTRSELFAAAIESYLRGHHEAGVTQRLNEIYREEDSSLDSVVAALQSASLARDEW
jgi:metal-responsive CopG/Arc/MetJ family transcriptional regulator